MVTEEKNIQKTPLDKVLESRGYLEPSQKYEFLHPIREYMHDPFLMKDMDRAVARFLKARENGEKLIVFGDYDADGVTATAALVRFCRALSIDLDYYIPIRGDEGYGISEKGIEYAISQNATLAITVDCGVSNSQEVELLKEAGIQTIITDHHVVPENIPDTIVLNPNRKDCTYPFKELAGVGVIFKFIHAVSQKLGMPYPEEYLPIVAVGTIADFAPLLGENRILVTEALKMFNSGKIHNRGLEQILEQVSNVDARTISFVVAPKINAAGRMGNASIAAELLINEDEAEVDRLLKEIVELNKQRQKTEEKLRKEIIFRLQDDPEFGSAKIAVASGENWHCGVIGITAAKISKDFNIPAFIISIEGDTARGSARGTDRYNIHTILEENSDILIVYGGHKKAGGFSIKRENIPILKQRIEKLEPSEDEATEEYDAMSDFEESTIKNIADLKLLEPYGEKNAPPSFIYRGVTIEQLSLVGKNRHLKLTMKQNGRSIKGIMFNKSPLAEQLAEKNSIYDIIGTPEIDEYNGRCSVSLNISKIEVASREQNPEIVDARNAIDRIRYIKNVMQGSDSIGSFVRTPDNKRKLEKLLSGSRCQLEILFYKEIARCSNARDLIFFSPPPSIDCFTADICRKAEKIHLLFTGEDIKWEHTLQELAYPSPQKMEKIKNFLTENPELSDSEAIASGINDPEVKPVTVEIALRILNELNLLEKREENLLLCSDVALDREELRKSKSFRMVEQMKDGFNYIEELCFGRASQLKEKILSFI